MQGQVCCVTIFRRHPIGSSLTNANMPSTIQSHLVALGVRQELLEATQASSCTLACIPCSIPAQTGTHPPLEACGMAETNVCTHAQVHTPLFSMCLATPLVLPCAVAAAAYFRGSSKHPLTCCCKVSSAERSTYTDSRACQVLCKQVLQPALSSPMQGVWCRPAHLQAASRGCLWLKSPAALVLPHFGQTFSLTGSLGGCARLRLRSAMACHRGRTHSEFQLGDACGVRRDCTCMHVCVRVKAVAIPIEMGKMMRTKSVTPRWATCLNWRPPKCHTMYCR